MRRPTPHEEYADEELARWPGVQATREFTKRHKRLVLTFRGQSRVVTYPSSSSDWRGPMKHACDIKRTLAAMGAERR